MFSCLAAVEICYGTSVKFRIFVETVKMTKFSAIWIKISSKTEKHHLEQKEDLKNDCCCICFFQTLFKKHNFTQIYIFESH